MNSNLIIRSTHSIPGRIRFYIEPLEGNKNLASVVEKILIDNKGVRGTNVNPITGKVLVEYDNNLLNPVKIEEMLKDANRVFVNTTTSRSNQRVIKDSPLATQTFITTISGVALTLIIAKNVFIGKSPLASNRNIFNTKAALTVITGYPIIKETILTLFNKGKIRGDTLLSLSTLGLLIIKESTLGLTVMWAVNLIRLKELQIREKNINNIYELIDNGQYRVTVVEGENKKTINYSRLINGQRVMVNPGEVVSFGGRVVDGQVEAIDIGTREEQVPILLNPGDMVNERNIIIAGRGLIQVTNVYHTSWPDMVDEISLRVNKSTARIGSSYLIGWQLLLIAISAYGMNRNIDNFIAFLLATNPRASMVAKTAGLGRTIGMWAKEGILVRNPEVIDTISRVDTLVINKRGILVEDELEFVEILRRTEDYSQEELYKIALSLEKNTLHPVAKALEEAYDGSDGLYGSRIERYYPGRGITGKVEDKEVMIGSRDLLSEKEINLDDVDNLIKDIDKFDSLLVYMAIDRKLQGIIVFRERVKDNISRVVQNCRSIGITNIVLLSGDDSAKVELMAERFQINHAYGDLTTLDKRNIIRGLRESGRIVAVGGNGINDLASLAEGDVSIVLSSSWIPVTLYKSDIVIVEGEIDKLIYMITSSKKINKTIGDRRSTALTVNGVTGALALLSYITPYQGAIINDLNILAALYN